MEPLWDTAVGGVGFSAYSTESCGGALTMQLNRREKVILQGEKHRVAKHCGKV